MVLFWNRVTSFKPLIAQSEKISKRQLFTHLFLELTSGLIQSAVIQMIFLCYFSIIEKKLICLLHGRVTTTHHHHVLFGHMFIYMRDADLPTFYTFATGLALHLSGIIMIGVRLAQQVYSTEIRWLNFLKHALVCKSNIPHEPRFTLA